MKVAWIVHDFDPGFGQGKYSVELTRRLAERHEVHVYANRFAAPLVPNLSYRQVPARRTGALATILTFAGAVDRLLRHRRYDIVHAQGLTGRKADVITAHICNAARRAERGRGSLKERIFFGIVCPLEKRFYQRSGASHLCAISNRVEGEIRGFYGWKGDASVIYHGTDCAVFRPAADAMEKSALREKLRLPGAAWLWLFVGEAVKGLADSIRQLPAFPEARLVAVSRSDLVPYQALASQINVRPRFHVVAPTNALAEYYRACDLFVYPSDYDAFGLVVAEAMASALPVVVGGKIGAAEWIDAGRNGLLCEAGDHASIHSRIARIKADPVGAEAMGVEARATVARHSWDECARELDQAYGSVMRRKARR